MRRLVQSMALSALLLATLAACYQQGLSEEGAIAAQVVAQDVTASPSPSPTPEAEVSPLASSAAQDGQIVLVAEGSTPLLQRTAIAQEGTDTWSLTATAYVALITQTQEIALTQTAAALGIGITPTLAPTLALATATPAPIIQPTQPGVVAPSIPGGSCVHEVRVGDNLFRLSLYYGLSINDIATANGIANIQLIVVGQKLNIPGCGTTGNLPPATSIPLATSAPALGTPGFGTGGPGVGGTIHTVQQYETLFIISQRYGVSVNSIAAANGISNINMIMIGQQLTIPSQ